MKALDNNYKFHNILCVHVCGRIYVIMMLYNQLYMYVDV